jgi:hypothetical protein
MEVNMATRFAKLLPIFIGCVLAVGGGLLCGSVFAQSSTNVSPHVPLQKTIGQAKPDVVPSLIVFNSKGASIRDGKLH